MTIKRKKASAYDTVNTAAICRYIKEHSGKIEKLIQDEAQLENVNRTALKQCAAELETVAERLQYAMYGIN